MVTLWQEWRERAREGRQRNRSNKVFLSKNWNAFGKRACISYLTYLFRLWMDEERKKEWNKLLWSDIRWRSETYVHIIIIFWCDASKSVCSEGTRNRACVVMVLDSGSLFFSFSLSLALYFVAFLYFGSITTTTTKIHRRARASVIQKKFEFERHTHLNEIYGRMYQEREKERQQKWVYFARAVATEYVYRKK